MSAALTTEWPEPPLGPGGAAVRRAFEDLARDLIGAAARGRDGAARRQVRTAHALYAVQGRPVRLEDGTVTAVVLIERREPDPPPDYEIRSVFPLTRRETEVARLIAHGLPNDGIATELHISRHTARHHTQSVLRKLGVRSREEVARRLWEARTKR